MANNSLDLDWQTSARTISLLKGNGALIIYNSLLEQARVGLKYDKSSKTILGSTPIAVANLDIIAQEYGARTPDLKDLSTPEIMRIAKDKYFIDSRNLVVRSQTDSGFPKNNSLLKVIYGLAEEKLGKIAGPFMIEGFSFVPNPEDKSGYGLSLVARPDFRVISDERFDGKYNGEAFSKVDEIGIPEFDKNGSKRWYAKSTGISRLCLGGSLCFQSTNSNLISSNDYGRIVLLKQSSS